MKSPRPERVPRGYYPARSRFTKDGDLVLRWNDLGGPRRWHRVCAGWFTSVWGKVARSARKGRKP